MDAPASLLSLAPEDREMIVLREIYGRSYDQIAATLGISRERVASRLASARRELIGRLGLNDNAPQAVALSGGEGCQPEARV